MVVAHMCSDCGFESLSRAVSTAPVIGCLNQTRQNVCLADCKHVYTKCAAFVYLRRHPPHADARACARRTASSRRLLATGFAGRLCLRKIEDGVEGEARGILNGEARAEVSKTAPPTWSACAAV